ncbi:MAG: FecR domain-containing protein [Natronospirillum sp.]|uniref:FecR family protein n=1 Tax=Natronospirillum sp. TaxID=2812955 RepID=UPI0025D5C759|nr:FecR domain-containing protein [Natronospirillum sp.]MCH8550904.1 FecR domain-containing protein [Natronospirillum sp.]
MSRGDVIAVGEDGTERELARRSEVMLGDQLSTGPDSRLQVRMVDDALLDLRSNTDIVLEIYQDDLDDEESRVLMELVGGTLSTLTGRFGDSDEDAYQLRTSNASIGIRGTGYAALYEEGSNTTYTSINSGAINLGSDGGSIPLGTDEAFRHGQAQDNLPPQGLLTPPPQLRQALLDEQLVREEDDDEESDEGTADNEGDTASSAPAPSTTPDDETITGDVSLADLRDDSVSESDVDENGLTDARLPEAIVEAAVESQVFLTAASGSFGSQFGLFANTPEDGIYALLYPDYPDLSDGYEEAFQVIRFSDDPELEIVFCGEGLQDPEIFCDSEGNTQGWFWGYWDSGLEVAVRDDYEELDQLWVMQVPADTSIDGFTEEIFFSSQSGEFMGTMMDGTQLLSNSLLEMGISSTGEVQFGTLEINTGDLSWSMTSGGGQLIDAGTLNIDDFAGTWELGPEEYDLTGDVSGVFRFDNGYYFLGTFSASADDPDGHSASGIIIAPEGP